MRKAFCALIPLLFALCLMFVPQVALASETPSCSVSAGQQTNYVLPGDNTSVILSFHVQTGTLTEISFSFSTNDGAYFAGFSSSGWNIAEYTPSFLRLSHGGIGAGGSSSIQLNFFTVYGFHGAVDCDITNITAVCSGETLSLGSKTVAIQLHTPGTEWVTQTASTCVDQGTEGLLCQDCSFVTERRLLPLGDHIPGIPYVSREPVCYWEGEMVTPCAVCNNRVSAAPIPMVDHVTGEDWIVVVEPTCWYDGLEEKHCIYCEFPMEQRLISRLSHTPEPDVVCPPGCTYPGYTDYYCSVCYEYLYNESPPATGHTPGEWRPFTPPSCTQEGWELNHCSVCDIVLDARQTAVLPHVPGLWQTVTFATCTLEGTQEKHCTACDALLETQSITATGHTAGAWQTVTLATCTQEGTQEKHCTDCDALLETQSIAATGHTAGAWQTVTAPTCTAEGTKENHCTTCNTLLETQPIAATGHTAGAWQTVTAPTCTAEGTKQKHCTTCNTLLETQSITATGHTAGAWQTVTDPTCTKKGKQEKHCTVCSALLNSRTVKATGHTSGEWVVTLRQTTEKPGLESKLCTGCGETLNTRKLPARSEPRIDSPASLPGESLEDTAPKLSEKYPTVTPVDLTKPQVLSFPLVAQGGYVVGTVTLTVDDKGQLTIAYTLAAKGAVLKAGGLAFLPTDRDLTELLPEDVAETTIDPAQMFTYTAPPAGIPQKDGLAMLCLHFVVDFDVYAEGVQEYRPEMEV